MPAPCHFAPSLLGAGMLGLKDKLIMARGLMEFLRGYPAEDSESVAQWFRRTGQTERAIRHFWKPILLATLNDDADHCSTRYAGQVFHELFVKYCDGWAAGNSDGAAVGVLCGCGGVCGEAGCGGEAARERRADATRGGWGVVCTDV